MSKLTNKRVLVTGGSSGLGQEIVKGFVRKGALVVFTYHNNKAGAEDTLKSVQGMAGKVYMIEADMANLASLEELVKQAVRTLGGIDILVNNAGTLTRHPSFLDIPMEAFDKIQAVNIRAPFFLSQLTGKQMIAQKTQGCIINILSQSAKIIAPGLTHYECSKRGGEALTEASASALAPYGIRVNAINPGLFPTEINREQRERDPTAWEKRGAQIPLGRTGNPEDIVHMVLMLASEKTAYVTGSIFVVDGGVGFVGPFNAPKPGEIAKPKL